MLTPHAALSLMAPQSTQCLRLSPGGVCCWRQHESRSHKTLARCVCDKSMALIVDDSHDVWSADLPNLCVVRRFVGDGSDDALQQLSQLLLSVHRRFYAGAAVEFSLDEPSRRPPDVRELLREMRGNVLSGCNIALTGVVAEHTEDALMHQPLCTLVRLYGGNVTSSVSEATHLVARQKPGWKQSAKIRRAAQRVQVHRRGAATRIGQKKWKYEKTMFVQFTIVDIREGGREGKHSS